jgi:membrane protein required for colicin V production
MNYLDILILVPIAFGAFKGFRRGLIIELAGLAALALGIYAGIHFSEITSVFLGKYMNIESEHMPILSFIITFLVVVIAVYLLGKVLEKLVDIVALSFINKFAGLTFGVLKVFLILSMLIAVFMRFNKDIELISQANLDDSVLIENMGEAGEWMLRAGSDIFDEEVLQNEVFAKKWTD